LLQIKKMENQVSIEKQVVNFISQQKRGTLFFPDDFVDFGSDGATRLALHRLENKDFLIRLAQGVYLYPEKDDLLGIIYPTIDEVAQAIAGRDKARIIPTGVEALNRLGLSTQVPMKVVYLTDGAPREVKVGKNSIKFKKTTPKNLAVKGEISGLVIQALRELGQEQVTESNKTKIHELLNKENPDHVLHDARLAPAWIRKIMLHSKETT